MPFCCCFLCFIVLFVFFFCFYCYILLLPDFISQSPPTYFIDPAPVIACFLKSGVFFSFTRFVCASFSRIKHQKTERMKNESSFFTHPVQVSSESIISMLAAYRLTTYKLTAYALSVPQQKVG